MYFACVKFSILGKSNFILRIWRFCVLHLLNCIYKKNYSPLIVYFTEKSMWILKLEPVGNGYLVSHFRRFILSNSIVYLNLVRKKIKSYKLKSKQVALIIADAGTARNCIKVSKKLNNSELEELVRIEAKKYISNMLVKVCFDYLVFDDKQSEYYKIVIIFAKSSLIISKIEYLKSLGLKVNLIDVESNCVLRILNKLEFGIGNNSRSSDSDANLYRTSYQAGASRDEKYKNQNIQSCNYRMYNIITRLLSKLATESVVQGKSERRARVNASIEEDSSTESMQKFASSVEFRKNCISENVIWIDISENKIKIFVIKEGDFLSLHEDSYVGSNFLVNTRNLIEITNKIGSIIASRDLNFIEKVYLSGQYMQLDALRDILASQYSILAIIFDGLPLLGIESKVNFFRNEKHFACDKIINNIKRKSPIVLGMAL
jgi:Tfp pilus assembly PilM family ATPase